MLLQRILWKSWFQIDLYGSRLRKDDVYHPNNSKRLNELPYYCSMRLFQLLYSLHYWCCWSYSEDGVCVTFHYLITKKLLNIFSAIIQVISTTNKLFWLLCEQLILTPPNSNMEVKCERKACVCIWNRQEINVKTWLTFIQSGGDERAFQCDDALSQLSLIRGRKLLVDAVGVH